MHGNTTDTLYVWQWQWLCESEWDCVTLCACVCTRENWVKEAEGVNRDLGSLPKTCLSHSEFAKWMSNLQQALGRVVKRNMLRLSKKTQPSQCREIAQIQQQLLGLTHKCWIYAWRSFYCFSKETIKHHACLIAVLWCQLQFSTKRWHSKTIRFIFIPLSIIGICIDLKTYFSQFWLSIYTEFCFIFCFGLAFEDAIHTCVYCGV